MKTIRGKLIASVIGIIALIIATAFYGGYQIYQVAGHAEKIYEHPYAVNNAVAKIRNIYAESNLVMSELSNGSASDISTTNSKVNQNALLIEEQFNIIEERFLGDKELFVEFHKSSDALSKNYTKIFEFLNQGNQSDASAIFQNKAALNYQSLIKKLSLFEEYALSVGLQSYGDAQASKKASIITLSIITLLILLFASLIAIYLIKSIIQPVKLSLQTAEEIATGNLNASFDTQREDEIGSLLRHIQRIVNNIKNAAKFTENIGKGELNAEFHPVGDNDTLGYSLLDMRSKLQEVADADEKRNWSIRGLAIFAEILRGNSDNVEVFGQTILSKLIEYLKINQGGLFLLDDSNIKEPKMKLIAAYAYDRLKFLNKEVLLGEGLVGQSWQENNKIYMTNVPQDYINIVSGLGTANPSAILIVPLKENDDIYGMVELASFHPFEPHEIDFVEKLAQSIGATFKNLKTSVQTNRLLLESQEMQQMMREQEEELRQNAEEMQATAEQVHKEAEQNRIQMEGVMKELRTRIKILDSMCLVSETNSKGEILSINSKFMEVAKYSEKELIGQPHNIVRHPDMPKEVWKAVWQVIGKGDTFRGIVKNKAKDGTAYWVDAVIAPKVGSNGKPDGYIGVRYDITEQIQMFDTYTITLGDQKWEIPTK